MVLLSWYNYNLDIGANWIWQMLHCCPFFHRAYLWILQKLPNPGYLSPVVTLARSWHLSCWPPFGQLWLPRQMLCFWQTDSTSVLQVNREKGERKQNWMCEEVVFQLSVEDFISALKKKGLHQSHKTLALIFTCININLCWIWVVNTVMLYYFLYVWKYLILRKIIFQE